jgi:hypothetical protein
VNDHERMHIDGLIHEACDLLCETSIHRCGGPRNALARLRNDPDGEGVWLDRFVKMFLAEHALNSEAGACAILEALARRPMPEAGGATIGEVILQASSNAFRELVRSKADEALERASIYEEAPS